MPAHTFQISVKEDHALTQDYVCARDKFSAMEEFMVANPEFNLDRIV